MEHIDQEFRKRQQQSKIVAGLLVIGFGTVFLLDRTGMNLPNWIYSWKMILIAVGLVSLVKHGFKHFAGYALILVGSIFLFNDFNPGSVDQRLVVPVAVIAIGFGILWKAIARGKGNEKKNHFETVMFDATKEDATSDYFEAKTVFGGMDKNIVSKNFRGAKITSVFGGTELNLTNADLKQPATIDTTTVFGGLSIAIPANWRVQSEITTIFGGIEDKRPMVNSSETEDHKVLILTGNCFFGGVEIHSYV